MPGKRKQTEQNQQETVDELLNRTPAQLIQEYHQISDYIKAESKRFDEFLAPHRARQDYIEAQLHKTLLALGSEDKARLATDAGTAYLSTIVTPKVIDREAFLKFCFDNWATTGNAMLQVGAPQKDSFKEYVEQHNGAVVPGTTVTSFTRVNINRA